MKRKMLVTLLCVSLTAGMLAGCGSAGQEAPAAPVEEAAEEASAPGVLSLYRGYAPNYVEVFAPSPISLHNIEKLVQITALIERGDGLVGMLL